MTSRHFTSIGKASKRVQMSHSVFSMTREKDRDILVLQPWNINYSSISVRLDRYTRSYMCLVQEYHKGSYQVLTIFAAMHLRFSWCYLMPPRT